MSVLAPTRYISPGATVSMSFKLEAETEKRVRDYCTENAVIFSEITRRLWVKFLDEKEKS